MHKRIYLYTYIAVYLMIINTPNACNAQRTDARASHTKARSGLDVSYHCCYLYFSLVGIHEDPFTPSLLLGKHITTCISLEI
jgi:hypothetical protein